MAKYKVYSCYRKREGEETVVDDSTMCTCADLDAAKRVFLGKVSQLTERACAAFNYTTLFCDAHVEDEDGHRPFLFLIDMECEDDDE